MSRLLRIAGLTGLVALLAAGLFLLGNIGGWRARILTRLLRVQNYPQVVSLPAGFQPTVPTGFKVSLFASGFEQPRWLAVAPNGAVFVADSAAGQVILLQDGKREVFAEGLTLPFGIAFLGDFVYIANTDEIVRFHYDPETARRTGNLEHIIDLPGHGYNQHWTRSLAVSSDGKQLYVSVGSQTNVSIEADPRRASILAMDPDGKNMRIYANGLRNAVGIATHPKTGQLWCSVNERDNLADDIPSDYFTHVIEGGFYGWPYAYEGSIVDNRVTSQPELVRKTITPDVRLGAHVAPLQFAFYNATQFPAAYRNGVFVAEHGSWNRRERSGYQVVFIPFEDDAPAGEPRPFMTGFTSASSSKDVYGRPVGVAVDRDGSLLVADDGSKSIWRISYINSGAD